jgi:hypothetical protein
MPLLLAVVPLLLAVTPLPAAPVLPGELEVPVCSGLLQLDAMPLPATTKIAIGTLRQDRLTMVSTIREATALKQGHALLQRAGHCGSLGCRSCTSSPRSLPCANQARARTTR